jgi:3-methyladenine DNA glycosylase AlkC
MRFKDYYTTEAAEMIAGNIAEGCAESDSPTSFDARRFVTLVKDQLECDGCDPVFSKRQDIFAEALEQTLPASYPDALDVLTRALGPPLETDEGMFNHGWWLWPIGRYVERNALTDPERSYSFIRELTKRFTGEFAVRPLLQRHPERTFDVLEAWAQEANVHVRRLASEGMRVSLPWARKVTTSLEHPDRFRAVLGYLRHAPEKFVQKSVGNNLNDVMKLEPDLAWSIIREWEADSPSAATTWIIKHGTRSLRKKKSKPPGT